MCAAHRSLRLAHTINKPQVFIDDDQTPYLLYASGHVNTHVTISRLSWDGTDAAGILSQIKGGLESPTILKGNGGYYLILSTTTGKQNHHPLGLALPKI